MAGSQRRRERATIERPQPGRKAPSARNSAAHTRTAATTKKMNTGGRYSAHDSSHDCAIIRSCPTTKRRQPSSATDDAAFSLALGLVSLSVRLSQPLLFASTITNHNPQLFHHAGLGVLLFCYNFPRAPQRFARRIAPVDCAVRARLAGMSSRFRMATSSIISTWGGCRATIT